jgi:hypothetical protein
VAQPVERDHRLDAGAADRPPRNPQYHHYLRGSGPLGGPV